MKKISFDWSKWLPILISGVALVVSLGSLTWNIIAEHARSEAHLEIWQRNTFYEGSEDTRTKITLLFRNLSHRPTAILDVYVRAMDGILEGRGYKNQIKLPIQIEPWGVREIEFKIEKNDEKRMTNILVRDIEDQEIVVIRSPGQTWVKSK